MADIVPSLFGLTPGMYQQAQQQRGDEMALQYAKLDPFQQANYAIGRGAYGLAGAAGGLLGGQDPELQRITARQQIASQINPSDPASIQQGIAALQQAGDTQGAMMLQGEFQKMQESMALVGQRKAASVASLAQAGRERTQATPEKIQLAKEVALLSGPEGSPEFNTAYATALQQQIERPGAKEPTTNELTNARAIASQAGPVGSPEYNTAFNAEYKRLTAEKASGLPSVGTDRTAISLELYNKPFDQLTSTERSTVNKRVEAEQGKRTPKIEVKNVIPGVAPVFDTAGMRAKVQDTIKSQIATISSTEQALQSIDDAIKTDNFVSFNAARTQLAKSLGDTQLSRRDIEQAGGDPSILGGLIDLTSKAFTSLPSIDTQKKIQSTLRAIQKVAQKQAKAEIDAQYNIAVESPGANPAAIKRALNFPQLQAGAAPGAGGDLAAQAAAELARRKGGK